MVLIKQVLRRHMLFVVQPCFPFTKARWGSSVLSGDFRFDKQSQLSERFLPSQVAHLDGDDFGNS